MFVGRNDELRVLEGIWSGRPPKTCAIYGRRRIGKTALVDNFCTGKKHIRFSFIRSTEEKNATLMDLAMARYKNRDASGLATFQQALDALSDIVAEEDIVIFMDELAYLLEDAPAASSELQHFIDHSLKGHGSMLIVCSSAVSTIRKEIERKDRPLYGRFINRIHVRQLHYWQCERMHPEMNRLDALKTYMMIGGYPAYHEIVQDSTFREAVTDRMLGPNAPLAEEAVNSLSLELSPLPTIEAMLLDIAQGRTDIKRIAEKEGLSKAICGRYLRRMEELDIVERVNPMANSDRKTAIYRIKDPLIGFWHMVLYRNLDIASSANRDSAYDAMNEDISTFLGFRFEEVCTDYMRNRFLCERIGKWWGWTDGETADIDIVAEVVDGRERYAILAECKFRNRKTGVSALEELEFRSGFVKGYNNVRFMIFSGSGFTEELQDLAESRNDLELVSLDDLFPGWDRGRSFGRGPEIRVPASIFHLTAFFWNIEFYIPQKLDIGMDEVSFRSVKSGEIRWSDNGQYCYFHPNPLPFELTIGADIQRLLDRTMILLGRLDGKVSQMAAPERDIILTAFALKESTLSSAIEGTGTTMGDMYRSSKQPERDRRRAEDNKEIANYRDALEEGLGAIADGEQLSEELLFRLHGTLLEGTRGSDRDPGSYRDCQVFVGNAGDDLETARYVPAPPDAVPWLMTQWFRYVNSDEYENPLIKVALAHYQFETVHPFKDGNGRMGRLTIMLMLRLEGALVHPVLYPSEFFNRYRSEYIERLSAVRENDEIEEWVGFFLKGLSTQAERSIQMIDRLHEYRKEILEDSGTNQAKAVEMLFVNPYVRVKDVEQALGITATSAAKIIGALESRGILRETTGQRRNRLYVAERILEILES